MRLGRLHPQILSPHHLSRSCRHPPWRWPRCPDVQPPQPFQDDCSSLPHDCWSRPHDCSLFPHGCSPRPPFPDGCSSRCVRSLLPFPDGCFLKHGWAEPYVRLARYDCSAPRALNSDDLVEPSAAAALHAPARSHVTAPLSARSLVFCRDPDPRQMPEQPGIELTQPNSATSVHRSKSDSLPPPELQNLFTRFTEKYRVPLRYEGLDLSLSNRAISATEGGDSTGVQSQLRAIRNLQIWGGRTLPEVAPPRNHSLCSRRPLLWNTGVCSCG